MGYDDTPKPTEQIVLYKGDLTNRTRDIAPSIMGIYRDIMALNPPKQVTPPNNEVIAFSKGYFLKKLTIKIITFVFSLFQTSH